MIEWEDIILKGRPLDLHITFKYESKIWKKCDMGGYSLLLPQFVGRFAYKISLSAKQPPWLSTE